MRRIRSNNTRSAILNLIEDRPKAGSITAEEVRAALQAAAPPQVVAYHMAVLAANGFLKRDGVRFQLA